MGCVSSKADLRPNIFQVWNVDERGNLLTQGQLEVTETELVLHQKGKEAIRWPMRCLRRYGFDAQVFSFESGRRCATGSGIYAFRSRRAEALFNLLQEHIQNSGQESDAGSQHMGSGHVLSSTATGMNVVHRSGSVSATDAGAYLEPISRHRPRSFSRDSFPPRSTCTPTSVPIPNSISCPSGGLIISPTGTSSVPRHNGDVVNYMNEDLSQVVLQTPNPEGSLEASPRSLVIPPCPIAVHEYVNTVAVAGEVTERRSSGGASGGGGGIVDVVPAEQKVSFSVLDLRQQSGGVVTNGPAVGDNTNYARLDDLMKQEQEAKHHLYMNVLPDIDSSKGKTVKNGTVTGSGSFSSTSSTCSSGSSTTSQGRLSLPPFAISHLHCYANVAPSARPKVTNTAPEPQGQPQANNNNNVNNNNNNNMNKSNKEAVGTHYIQHHHHHGRHHHGHHHHHSLSYPQAAGSTAVTRQVNYVILDLDRGAQGGGGGGVGVGAEAQCSSSSSLPVSPTSPTSVTGPPVSVTAVNNCSQVASQPPDSPTRGAAEGYATIDFDRTAALSNTVNPCLDDESIRKTRHNSTIADLPILRHNSTVGD